MGQSADELRYEIAQTRGRMGETLDAIGDRVSPRRMVERGRLRTRDRVSSMRDRVMGTSHDMMDSVRSEAGHMGGGAGNALSSATDTIRSAPQQARLQTQGSPFGAGLVALGVGMLAAALIPPTDAERRAAEQLMQKAEPLKNEAMEIGKSMASGMQDAGRHAAVELKEAAQHRAEDLKQTAQHEAASTRESAVHAAETVRGEAGGAAANIRRS